MSSGLPHSTTQAHDQPQNPGPPPEDEHPNDLRSRPNDARNDHKTADSGIDDVNYPPQLHAGKVGLGPHYGEQNRVALSEQVEGLKEEIKGRLKHDEHMREEGHERITGEFKRKQHEKENAFDKPGGAGPQGDKTKENQTVEQTPSTPPVAAPGTK